MGQQFKKKTLKSRKLFYKFTRGFICNVGMGVDRLLEELKHIIQSPLSYKEDLRLSEHLSLFSDLPSESQPRCPDYSVEMQSYLSLVWLGKDSSPGTSEVPCGGPRSPAARYLTEVAEGLKHRFPGGSGT